MSLALVIMIYIVKIAFYLYSFALLMRIILHFLHADEYNAISQFIIKITQWPVQKFKTFLPVTSRFDFAAIGVLVVVELVKVYLLVGLELGRFANIIGVLLYSVGDLLWVVLDIYFYAIIIAAIISWVRPATQSALVQIVNYFAEPVLRLFRRFIPPLGGFDLSPIAAIVAIKVIEYLVVGLVFIRLAMHFIA